MNIRLQQFIKDQKRKHRLEHQIKRMMRVRDTFYRKIYQPAKKTTPDELLKFQEQYEKAEGLLKDLRREKRFETLVERLEETFKFIPVIHTQDERIVLKPYSTFQAARETRNKKVKRLISSGKLSKNDPHAMILTVKNFPKEKENRIPTRHEFTAAGIEPPKTALKKVTRQQALDHLKLKKKA
jgi:hypothetical protein